MGWYDAFNSASTAGAVLNATTSNSGSAAKNFGDAFSDIGKSMREVDAERKKEEVADSTIKSNDAQTVARTTKNTQAILDNEQTNKDYVEQNARTEQKKIDDAFKRDFNTTTDVDYQKSLIDFEKPDGEFDSNVSSDAFAYAQKKIDSDELKAQKLFNDEAVKVSVDGGYKDFKSFREDSNNSELIKNSDGATMKSIEKWFTDKDTTSKDIKTQQKLLNKDKQILALAGSKKNAGFKYDENTDTKIATQVKTAMGMDAPDFTFTDATKKAYEDAVAGSAKISKAYNLEPSLAIHVYRNPDNYDFTVDGKVLQKKQAPTQEKKTTTSWKDYQTSK